VETEAIIFDLDGVLVNSMPYHVRSWQEAFERVAGIRVSKRDIYLLEGMRGAELIAKILADKNGEHVSEELVESVNQEKNRVFRSMEKSAPFAGLEKGLDRIVCPKAVVSGSAKDDVEAMLGDGFGRHKFAAVVTADDIDRGKPDPAAFLEAARRIRSRPSSLLVIENAPLGALAARKAGMQCYVALNNSPLRKVDFGQSVDSESIFDTTLSALKHVEVEMNQ
jgi:HAD superfamily hydrolase (TIGR01509 family)